MTTTSTVDTGRRRAIRATALVAAALLAVALLAVGIPTLQRLQASKTCGRLGGQLGQAIEAVEPLVSARTVYRCYGPGGTVLASW